MKAACMPINHLHDPAVILSLHTASTNQTAPRFNGPPSHWTKQLTHPWSIRLIIHLFLQILQFCFWPPPAELKIQLCPIGHCTRSVKSALSKKHLPHHQHLLLQIETSGSPTFPQPESHCMSLYEFVHGGYFPDFELNVKAVPHNLPRQVELLEAEILRKYTDRSCCLPPPQPSQPTETLQLHRLGSARCSWMKPHPCLLLSPLLQSFLPSSHTSFTCPSSCSIISFSYTSPLRPSQHVINIDLD